MILAILREIDGALLDLSRGGHFMGIMIGDWTVWPLSWLIEELKDRIKK